MTALTVATIGHSTREIGDLVGLLRVHGVTRLVDVRTIPRSRRHPQFDRDAMPGPLAAAGIGYAHLAGLGGLRRPRADSVNTAWRNAGFRGYADYMQTEAFERHLLALLELADHDRVAIMCAEAVPWRCHRSLVSDALVARGVAVAHITSGGPAAPHAPTAFACIDGTRVTYPAAPEQAPLPFARLT